MLEQAQIAEQFQTLMQLTDQAQRNYAQMSLETSDPAISQKLLQLHKDKQRHIRLIQRLLEIVN
jgi:rubrerythrin